MTSWSDQERERSAAASRARRYRQDDRIAWQRHAGALLLALVALAPLIWAGVR